MAKDAKQEATKTTSFGAADEAMSKLAKEVDPFESIPTVVPGKPGDSEKGTPGFLEGMTYRGRYVRTKRVVSDKFEAGKVDAETGEKYRDLHILRDGNGIVYGIWSVGALGAAMRSLQPNDYIEITYTGLGEKPLRPGQGKPHTFKFKGTAANGGPLVFNWDAEDTVPPMNTSAPQGASAQQ